MCRSMKKADEKLRWTTGEAVVEEETQRRDQGPERGGLGLSVTVLWIVIVTSAVLVRTVSSPPACNNNNNKPDERA